jgi:hypothetical protein
MQGKTTKRRHSDMLYIPHSSSSTTTTTTGHFLRSFEKAEKDDEKSEQPTSRSSSCEERHMLTRAGLFFLFSSKPKSLCFPSPLKGLLTAFLPKHSSQKSSRRHKPTSNIHPLRDTAPLFTLNIHNISVTSTPTPDTVLLLGVPLGPVVVVLFQELLIVSVDRCALLLEIRSEVGLAGQLAGGSVCRTVLDGGVSVAEIAEVVDVRGREEGAGCEGVDGCVAPLGGFLACAVL